MMKIRTRIQKTDTDFVRPIVRSGAALIRVRLLDQRAKVLHFKFQAPDEVI